MLSRSLLTINGSNARLTGTAPLPSKKELLRLQDIVDNAVAIERYTKGMTLETFRADSRTYDAVERCLERISEAAAKLGDRASELVPGQPWPKIRALGNRLRHEYDMIREDRLWSIIESDLTTLREECQRAIQRVSR